MYFDYEPFEDVEEVWFWFCSVLSVREEGARGKEYHTGRQREIELNDMYRIVKKAKISNRCLRVLAKWGKLRYPPYHAKYAKKSEIRQWFSGLGRIDSVLRSKGIIK